MRKDRLHTKRSKFAQYFVNWAIWCTQTLSILLGGDPDETVSSRTGKAIRAYNNGKTSKWWFAKVQGPFIDFLLNEKDHCLRSIEEDEGAYGVWDWEN